MVQNACASNSSTPAFGSVLRCLLPTVLAAAIGASTGTPSPVEAAENPSIPSKQLIEETVRDYLLTHPEILEEAARRLAAKKREGKQERERALVRSHRDALLHDAGSPVGGNPAGDVTVVEFFDYRCGYCKAMEGTVRRLVADDPNIRIVYKEFPVLGEESSMAARAALAAVSRGKYRELHAALMAAEEPLTLPAILQIAARVGLDPGELQAEMGAARIAAILERNRALARALSIDGTPAFVVGIELIPGAIDLHTLKALVSYARSQPEPRAEREAASP